MAGAVADEADQGLGLADQFEQQLDQLEVGDLVAAADVVDGAGLAALEGCEDAATVVLDVDPVADVGAVAVDRQFVVGQGVVDHQRDQFLGELVGAVVVGRARDDRLVAKGFLECAAEQVGRGLAGGVGGVGLQRGLLAEAAVGAERAVDLVGGDLQEAADAAIHRRPQQHHRSQDVGVEEGRRLFDRAVDVRFRGEVDDGVGAEVVHQAGDCRRVGDVAFLEAVGAGVGDLD